VRSQGDNWYVLGHGKRFEELGGFPSVQHGQAHIHKDQVRVFTLRLGHAFVAIHCHHDFIAASFQTPGKHIPVHLVVLN